MSTTYRLPADVTRKVGGTCLCLYTQRAARALGRHFDAVFRPLELTNGQFSLMMSLNRPAPPTLSQVATFLAMDRTTVTAAVKPLERRKLVEISVDGADRRSRRLALTTAGHELLARAVPIWERAHVEIEARLGGSDPERLRDDLRALS